MQNYCMCVHTVDQCPAKHQPGPCLGLLCPSDPLRKASSLCHAARVTVFSSSVTVLVSFFQIALLLWRDSNSLGGASMRGSKWQLWGAGAVTAALPAMLRHGTLPRQPGADTGGRRQLEPALVPHNLAYCPIQIHKKSCTLPVY